MKVIDMMADEAVQSSVAAEIDVFKQLPPHKHISTGHRCTNTCAVCVSAVITVQVFLSAVYLQDHFESQTFHFLVFEL